MKIRLSVTDDLGNEFYTEREVPQASILLHYAPLEAFRDEVMYMADTLTGNIKHEPDCPMSDWGFPPKTFLISCTCGAIR